MKNVATCENFHEIKTLTEPTISTGNQKLDEWWSAKNNIVIGTSIFVTGTSGAGKTTFSVFLAKILNQYSTLIYSREMHRSHLKEQTQRLNIDHNNLWVADQETCPTFEEFMNLLDERKPKFVVVDSLQVVSMEDYPDENQEKIQYAINKRLRNWIIDNRAVLFVIGHNTKEGEFKGSNTNMQMFDAHIEMIHNQKDDCRTIAWGKKNRKGPLKKLYYEFTEQDILFYTPKEWKNKQELTVNVDVNLSALDYLEMTLELSVKEMKKRTLDYKKHTNWKNYISYFDEEFKKIKAKSKIEAYSKTLVLMEAGVKTFLI